MTRGRRLLLLLLAFLAVSAPAFAHPKGQRPIIAMHRTSTGFDVSWVVAADDMRAVGDRLKLGPISPTAFDDSQAYQDYVADRLLIEADAPCAASMLGVSEVATGFSTALFFDCGGEVSTAELTTRLLLDISKEYVHIYDVGTPSGTKRGTLTSGDPSVEISFAMSPTAEPDPRDEVDGQGKLEDLVRGGSDVPLIAGIGIALVLGAVHGLTPGHGKTLTAAYIAGMHGTMRHAAILSGVVALAHGASTLALAGIAAGIDKFAPETVIPWLEGAAAVLAAIVGVMLLRGAQLHGHSHAHGEPLSRKLPLAQLVAIGVVGGLIPGPEAFAVGFLAVALEQVTLGLVLIAAFSLGLAAVVFGIAALAVVVGDRIGQGERTERVARILGGLVFLAVAAFLAARALTG